MVLGTRVLDMQISSVCVCVGIINRIQPCQAIESYSYVCRVLRVWWRKSRILRVHEAVARPLIEYFLLFRNSFFSRLLTCVPWLLEWNFLAAVGKITNESNGWRYLCTQQWDVANQLAHGWWCEVYLRCVALVSFILQFTYHPENSEMPFTFFCVTFLAPLRLWLPGHFVLKSRMP